MCTFCGYNSGPRSTLSAPSVCISVFMCIALRGFSFSPPYIGSGKRPEMTYNVKVAGGVATGVCRRFDNPDQRRLPSGEKDPHPDKSTRKNRGRLLKKRMLFAIFRGVAFPKGPPRDLANILFGLASHPSAWCSFFAQSLCKWPRPPPSGFSSWGSLVSSSSSSISQSTTS